MVNVTLTLTIEGEEPASLFLSLSLQPGLSVYTQVLDVIGPPKENHYWDILDRGSFLFLNEEGYETMTPEDLEMEDGGVIDCFESPP